MDAKSSELVVDIARMLMATMERDVPGWQRAFWRFDASDSHYGSTGSYVTDQGISLLDPFTQPEFFEQANAKGASLREDLRNEGRGFCVALLQVNAHFDFKMDYEWKDPRKWVITKMNGASGMPSGLE